MPSLPDCKCKHGLVGLSYMAKNADFIKDLAPLKYPLAEDPMGLLLCKYCHMVM